MSACSLCPTVLIFTLLCWCSSLDTLVEWVHVSPNPFWQHQTTVRPSLTWCKQVSRTPSDGHSTASLLFYHTISRSLHWKLRLTFSLNLQRCKLGLLWLIPFCSNFWYLKTIWTLQSSLDHGFPSWFASLSKGQVTTDQVDTIVLH